VHCLNELGTRLHSDIASYSQKKETYRLEVCYDLCRMSTRLQHWSTILGQPIFLKIILILYCRLPSDLSAFGCLTNLLRLILPSSRICLRFLKSQYIPHSFITLTTYDYVQPLSTDSVRHPWQHTTAKFPHPWCRDKSNWTSDVSRMRAM
jgi:hypothetical protein